MVLNEYRVRSEREARERVALELERERKARLAAESKAEAAASQAVTAEHKAEAAESKADAARRRSDRLMAALVEALKDKGVDPKLLAALLEEEE